MSRQPADDDLAAVVEPLVAAAGAELEDVTVRMTGRRTLLQVFVDADGGIGLDEIAEISAAISTKLDETDLLGAAPYTLEVSSPGADRPLTAPKHWRRAAGRLVRAQMRDGHEIIGRIARSDDSAVTLEVGGGKQRLAYEEIAKARVEVEFSRGRGDSDEGR